MRPFFVRVGHALKWIWRWIGNALRWKTLLEVCGWWDRVVGWWQTGLAAVVATITAIAALIQHLPIAELIVLSLAAFLLVLLVIAGMVRVADRIKPQPRATGPFSLPHSGKYSPRLCLEQRGLHFEYVTLSTSMDRPVLDATGRAASVGSRHYHCLKLYLKNDPLEIAKDSTTVVRADIVFYATDGSEHFRIPGRWADGPQPGKVPLADMLRMEFAPGDPHELDIALKYHEDEACYAMNHMSYYDDGFRYPANRLPAGRIRATAILKGIGVNCEVDLDFMNPGAGGELAPGSYSLREVYT